MIEPKKKKCKGIGKAIEFEGCSKEVFSRKYGLCSNCYRVWLYSTDEGNKQVERLAIKAKKEVYTTRKEADKQKINAMKKNVTNWKNVLQVKVQEIARLIDYGQPCIVLGYVPSVMDGGHVYSKGAFPEMRFNLHNIHRQSRKSNSFNSDDALMIEKIELEYGKRYLAYIQELRNKPQVKLSQNNYHEIVLRARKIANSLSKHKRIRSAEQRISMRNTINGLLNIYPRSYSIYKL